jgi:molecular chaperone Hsp33
MSVTDAGAPLADAGGADDRVLPFAVEALDVRGRVIRLGAAVDRIVSRHGYPEPVARVVAEAATLVGLLGTALKFDGRLQLQTRSDGPVGMIVVDFDTPDRLRAMARFDAGRIAALGKGAVTATGDLLGHGHLALTIDQGSDMNRYQGVVALTGRSFEEVAHLYFQQSEQIPTRVRLAAGQVVEGGRSTWRAGGLLVQFLPESPERRRSVDLDPGDAPEGHVAPAQEEDDAWTEAATLAVTAEDHELLDPTLSSERLLYRLFHERGVRVFEAQRLHEACRCSRERILDMLKSFSQDDRRDMIGEDGRIGVTCEFCSTHYVVEPAEAETPPPPERP